MRKSIKIAPGVRLTATHKSASLRVGGRAAGASLGTSGRKSFSAGIPGSGVRYETSSGARRRSRPASEHVLPPKPPKPGLFAPASEKDFYKGVQALAEGNTRGALDLFRSASAKDSSNRGIADELFAGLLSAQLGEDEQAVPYLERVVSTNRPLPDDLMRKYAPNGGIRLGITDETVVEISFGSLAAALTLAEIYQRQGRIDEAIGVTQQLAGTDAHPFILLSLCDLYAEIEAWDELVDTASGVFNEDDVTLNIRLLQARAFAKQGLPDAAFEAYKDCLKSKKRDSSLLKEARYERALLYVAAGKKAQGRKELEKIYAEDVSFRDVRAQLDGLTV